MHRLLFFILFYTLFIILFHCSFPSFSFTLFVSLYFLAQPAGQLSKYQHSLKTIIIQKDVIIPIAKLEDKLTSKLFSVSYQHLDLAKDFNNIEK
jgi:hypothetical protein